MPSLPEPDAEARAHSAALLAQIRAEIDAGGGWLSFARYMDRALYAPGLGYYAGGATKFGGSGDFVTAPLISPLFARCLAQPVAAVLAQKGGVLELGAGTGELAAGLLAELAALDALPARYAILEVSADLRQRQRACLQARVPQWLDRVEWIDALPEVFDGVILGNEVLDALPVHLLHWHDGQVSECGVVWQEGRLGWGERPVADARLAEQALALAPGEDYRSEIGLAGPALVADCLRRLQCGLVLMIDYGFGAREYYHPQRREGTLMCHYRHQAHADPLWWPGLQDITAHVDFSALQRSAAATGAVLQGYTSQAAFLIDCGLTELLGQTPASDAAAYLPLVAGVQKLVSPAEMGELFKVIGWSRGLDVALQGFRRADRRGALS